MRILPSGEPCLSVETLDSTNAEARRRAAMGERGPLWILAARQSAGRGRRGREWISAPGNLYATHLGPTARGPAERPQLALVAAVAAAEALRSLLPGEAATRIRCKWPNDLVIGEAKLGGILLESEAGWVATGIGVNFASAPSGLDRPATSLREAFGITVAPEAALEAIAVRYADWRTRWVEAGFPAVRAAWLALGPAPGRAIALRPDAAGAAIRGRFAGLDESGALLMADSEGRTRRFTAGEVLAGEGQEQGACC